MTRVLFLNTPPRNCGVHAFGETTANILSRSTRLEFVRAQVPETTTEAEYYHLLSRHAPDFVLYNYHPFTMPWLVHHMFVQARKKFPNIQHVSISHDCTPRFPHLAGAIFLDPTFEETTLEMKVGRLIPEFKLRGEAPNNVIGTFGYASKHKNFPSVVELANEAFDEATVRIHMPAGFYGDPDGRVAEAIGNECKAKAKPGINVVVTHDFKTTEQLIEWLSQNTVNCFLYEYLGESGISSAIDYSLAAQRPIAVSDSYMFRHILKECPGVRVATRSLKEIIADGFAPLEPLRQRWSAENLLRDYERIFEKIQQRPVYNLTSNRVLSAADREALKPVVEELRQLEPEIMSRKIPEAVFQNAFIFEQAKRIARRSDDILLVGGTENPIGPALKKLGHKVRFTDPAQGGRDARDLYLDMLDRKSPQYDLVVSCSVIEQEEQDEAFIYYLYSLLKPGGTALLMVNYNEQWREGMHKPDSDVRIYTAERMRKLAAVVPPEALLDEPTWGPSAASAARVGASHGFCSLAFLKPPGQPAQVSPPPLLPLLEQHVRSLAESLTEAENAYDFVHGEYHKLDRLLATVHEELSKAVGHREHEILHRDHHIRHQNAEIERLQAEQNRLLAELDRFGQFKEAGPQAIRLVNTFYRLAKMTPRWMRGGVKRCLGLMRGIANRLRGKRSTPEQAS